jgi:hypothetical protein
MITKSCGVLGLIAAALALIATCSQAFAQSTSTSPPTPAAVSAVTSFSPSLSATPGAKAAADMKAAKQASAKNEAKNVDVFRDTNATLHSENQCILADFIIIRFVPDMGDTTTFVSYNVRNFCDPAGSGAGDMELPDLAFTGDPRTDDSVTVHVNLSGLPDQVQGTPLVADITWTKTDRIVTDGKSTSSTITRDNGYNKLAFKSTFHSTSAAPTGTANLFTVEGITGTISWDDFKNITVIR